MLIIGSIAIVMPGEARAALRLAVIRHLRLLVKGRADPVADQLGPRIPAPSATAARHDDIADVIARAGLRDARGSAAVSPPADARSGVMCDRERGRGIACNPSSHSPVDAHDVAVVVARACATGCVHDLVIDRCTERGREIVQPLTTAVHGVVRMNVSARRSRSSVVRSGRMLRPTSAASRHDRPAAAMSRFRAPT